MTAHEAAIDFKESTIRLDNIKFQLYPPSNIMAPLRSTKSIMVPAYTAISVPVKLNKQFKTSYLLITEPKCLKHLSKDLAITPTVLSMDKDTTHLCRVINTSATPVIVPAGSLIALQNPSQYHVCLTLKNV